MKEVPFLSKEDGTFLWGLRRGGSLVNFLQIEEGQTCFILNRGRVTVFLARNFKLYTPCSFPFVYTSKATSQD